MAEFKFLGSLADIVGVRIKVVKLEKAVPLKETLPSTFREINIIILINQKVGNLDSVIQDEDSIVLMPIVSGG